MKSILVPMIAGYLEYHRGFNQSYHRQFVMNESNRIAAKIHDTFGFGNFDESNEESCASVIRVVMAKPEYQSIKAGTLQPKNPQAERERWEKKVLAEAKAREERDARLRAQVWW